MSVPIPVLGDIGVSEILFINRYCCFIYYYISGVNKTALQRPYSIRTFCGQQGQDKITFISDNLMYI